MNSIGRTIVSGLLGRTSQLSQIRSVHYKKRRKTYPFFWLQDQHRGYYKENLTEENEKFFQQFLKEKYSSNQSPLKKEPWPTNEQYTHNTARTGLVAKKLGVSPMWTKSGDRTMATCLQVLDNHVIKYHSPEEFSKTARPVDRVRYAGLGCIVIGSESKDPRAYTAEYTGLFNESGVMPKKKLTRFLITHNARIEPGTPLLASHFRPGMYVDIYGKSTWRGFVGLRRRYKLRLIGNAHGCTKAHNRIGSIGRGRQHAGPLKGRRMPGPHGNERVITPGLLILRVNTKYNLIYVKNRGVPGPVGGFVNIMDSRMPKKQPTEENPPPFPTTSLEEDAKLPQDIYDECIHVPSQPSIIFEITEEERKAAAMSARRDKAKTAQKIR